MPIFQRKNRVMSKPPLRNIGYYRSKALKERAKDPDWLRRFADKEFGMGSPDPKEDAENRIKLSIANQAVTMIEKDPDLRTAAVERYLESLFGSGKDNGASLESADPMETVLRYSKNIKELKEFFRDDKETSNSMGALAGVLSALIPHLPALINMIQQGSQVRAVNQEKLETSAGVPVNQIPSQDVPVLDVRTSSSMQITSDAVSVPVAERDPYKDVIGSRQDAANIPISQAVGQGRAREKILNPLNPDFLLSLSQLESNEAASFFMGAIEAFMEDCEPFDQLKIQAFMGGVEHQTWTELVKFLSPYRNHAEHGQEWGEVLDFLNGNPEWSQEFFVRVRVLWVDLKSKLYGTENEDPGTVEEQ